MKTDSIFYRLFQRYPRSFFELLHRPPDEANIYQFTSVEVKQLSFRLDGLFLPTTNDSLQPFYLVEVQFQLDEELYYRIFSELFLYLRQYQPSYPWRVVIIYSSRNIEREQSFQFREILDCSRVTRIYLDEIPAEEKTLGVKIIQLILESEENAISSAQRLITQAQETLAPTSLQRDIIDLIETIIIYKLSQYSREEIAQMLGLNDIKQTRFYQEVLLEERKRIIQRLTNRGNSPETIAEMLGLSLEEVTQVLQSLEDN